MLFLRAQRASLAGALGIVLIAGCGGPRAAIPPRTGTPAPPAEASAAPAAPPPAQALPFHLPCADDDLAGCTTGCNDKHPEDCVTLASMYLAGGLVEKDQERALGMFRAACTEGSARGCIRLGDAYHRGLLHGDEEELDCYRRACDAGANLGCVAAGRAYLAGRGAPTDPVFAATLFSRVCDRGNAPACFELAQLYQAGLGVKKDAARSFELFRKACKLGLDEGCLIASRTEETLPPRD